MEIKQEKTVTQECGSFKFVATRDEPGGDWKLKMSKGSTVFTLDAVHINSLYQVFEEMGFGRRIR